MDPHTEDAQDHNIFISLTGALFVTVNSRKDKGKALKKHTLKDIVPCGFEAKIEEIQEKHQHAIEEKDATIALLNDDLQDLNMKMWFTGTKGYIRTSYKNVKTSLPILEHIMSLAQKIQAKTTLL